MVTGYQRTEFRSWATGPCTGTSSWDSCVWGSGYFGGFRETKGKIILFHCTVNFFSIKLYKRNLLLHLENVYREIISVLFVLRGGWWRIQLYYLRQKKDYNLIIIIINYWFTAMPGLYRTFWGLLFAWTS